MMKSFLFTVILVITMASCINVSEKDKKDVLIKKIETYENKYFSNKQYQANMEDLDTMINIYSEFIEEYKSDSLTANYMFKKANLYVATQNYDNAIFTFNNICTDYPDFDKRPEAIFYQAMIYGDYLHNEILAEQKYKEFIADYPNHDLSDDAEKSIEFLGKTDAEIIEMLTKKDTLQ